MKRIIKAGLMLLLGAAIWTNGGTVKDVSAEPGGDGICKAGWLVTYEAEYTYCVLPNGSCRYHPSGGLPACAQSQPTTNTRSVPPKPSSYGAVAWDGKLGLYGSSTKQASKQAGIDAALKKCGSSTCQLQTWYANQCVAVAYGLQPNGKYLWVSELGVKQATAENKARTQCGKDAKNCQILLSECSLAGDVANSQTQQYKGLGE
jgi:hypothetical protein